MPSRETWTKTLDDGVARKVKMVHFGSVEKKCSLEEEVPVG